MLRVAMLSFWHVHASDYATQTQQHPATEVVAAWDELPERGRTESAKLGVPFYNDLHELLAQSDIDAVIVDTPTNLHHDVMIAAARAGKHIFTEKVIAPTLHEVNAILAAVTEAEVILTVSLPRLYHSSTLAIQNIVQRKILGELTLVRTRLSHNGATNNWLPAHFFALQQTGGGALIDLGCHPMYLTRLFLGLPESVNANFGYVTGRQVEDNAVAVLRYPNGAFGLVEAGFVNRYSPFTIEIHGTEGSLFFGTPDAKLLVRSSKLNADDQWIEQKELPADQPMAFEQWVKHIQEGTPATANIQAAVDLTKLMEAANLSATTNQPVRLEDLLR